MTNSAKRRKSMEPRSLNSPAARSRSGTASPVAVSPSALKSKLSSVKRTGTGSSLSASSTSSSSAPPSKKIKKKQTIETSEEDEEDYEDDDDDDDFDIDKLLTQPSRKASSSVANAGSSKSKSVAASGPKLNLKQADSEEEEEDDDEEMMSTPREIAVKSSAVKKTKSVAKPKPGKTIPTKKFAVSESEDEEDDDEEEDEEEEEDESSGTESDIAAPSRRSQPTKPTATVATKKPAPKPKAAPTKVSSSSTTAAAVPKVSKQDSSVKPSVAKVSRPVTKKSDAAPAEKPTAAKGKVSAGSSSVSAPAPVPKAISNFDAEFKDFRRSASKTSVVLTSLSAVEHARLRQAINALGRFRVVERVDACTTHIITGAGRRTMNVLIGVSRGCWIMKPTWILDSFEAGHYLSETEYEAKDWFPIAETMRKEKELLKIRGGHHGVKNEENEQQGDLEKQVYHEELKGILKGLKIFIGKTNAPVEELDVLVVVCGGRVSRVLFLWNDKHVLTLSCL